MDKKFTTSGIAANPGIKNIERERKHSRLILFYVEAR